MDAGALIPTELEHLLAAQRAAYRRAPYPSARERVAHLDALCDVLRHHAEEFAVAADADFGHRAAMETQLIEIFPALNEARHARAHVQRWMRPQRRRTTRWFLPGRAQVLTQPLGVVGVIVPWNYPILLAFGPLVGALAAGNRVMIKMSELTPRVGALLGRVLATRFAPEHVAVVNGGTDIARAFAALAFDHLLFTGSGPIGREVMRAASANLTPVTLELGGKSPAIVAPDFPVALAAQRILRGKCLNAGQTCIAPDYVLLPESALAEFTNAAHAAVRHLYPGGAASPDYCAIINERHHARLVGYLEDARERGAQVLTLCDGSDAARRKLAPTLLAPVHDDMRVMQEEIFGPLLPLVTYRRLDDALAHVAARPHPLALYYFDRDRARTRRVLAETHAGGVTVNDTLLHIAQSDLPFGGVGASGMGHYHGEDGFHTFSTRKGVFHQTRVNAVGLLEPPFGRRVEWLLRWLLR